MSCFLGAFFSLFETEGFSLLLFFSFFMLFRSVLFLFYFSSLLTPFLSSSWFHLHSSFFFLLFFSSHLLSLPSSFTLVFRPPFRTCHSSFLSMTTFFFYVIDSFYSITTFSFFLFAVLLVSLHISFLLCLVFPGSSLLLFCSHFSSIIIYLFFFCYGYFLSYFVTV